MTLPVTAEILRIILLWLNFIPVGFRSAHFNPLSRIHHEGDNPVEPWLFGPEAEKNAKAGYRTEISFLPYIYTYAREAHDTGLPIMRPLFLEYPTDMETFSTDAQFMFGSELLVAPVVKKGARNKNVYLPEGTGLTTTTNRRHIPESNGYRGCSLVLLFLCL